MEIVCPLLKQLLFRIADWSYFLLSYIKEKKHKNWHSALNLSVYCNIRSIKSVNARHLKEICIFLTSTFDLSVVSVRQQPLISSHKLITVKYLVVKEKRHCLKSRSWLATFSCRNPSPPLPLLRTSLAAVGLRITYVHVFVWCHSYMIVMIFHTNKCTVDLY